MRRVLATLVLICFGALLPMAAGSVRICLLDKAERKADCCSDCGSKHGDCCIESKKVPDATSPGTAFELPAFTVFEIPWFATTSPREIELVAGTPGLTPPIRGPDSPAAYRSVLNVWRV